MSEWSQEQLNEICGNDVIDRLKFLSGCTQHRLVNDPFILDSWIISDESLRKFAELIVQECASIVYKSCQDGDAGAQAILYEFDIDNARSQK